MLRSLKQLYGDKLGASDGEIGRVKDFYFDDQSWAVRYLIVDTGSWLPGRQVLITPHSCGRLQLTGKALLVNLRREQIEHSPSIEEHKPVSRQFEAEYYGYFGWPYYWEGEQLWGLNGFPALEPPTNPAARKPYPATDPKRESDDPHLRSTQAVKGYHIQARDGDAGHVFDFMMDDHSWAIGQLVVKTGHRPSGKEVLIPTSKVDRISYEESTVFVNLTKEAVEQSPAPALPPAIL